MTRRLSSEEYRELYNESPEEFNDPPTVECVMCGQKFKTDQVSNWMCDDCADAMDDDEDDAVEED